MNYLLKQYQPRQLLFVDGWIGKGAILDELRQAVEAYEGVSPDLAVAADPANVTALWYARGHSDTELLPELYCVRTGEPDCFAGGYHRSE